MEYEKLIIKSEYIGKTIFDNNKTFILNDEITTQDKRYIFEMITKQVFDMHATTPQTTKKIVDGDNIIKLSRPVGEAEIKAVKKIRKPRTTKPKK